jgi:Fanconi anemia group M protein
LAEAVGRVMHRPVRVERLALGDVQVGERLRVERKAAADFVASLAGGRLERQLLAQLRAGGRVVLIVEGEFTPQALGGMADEAVRRAMLSVALDLRVAVLRSRDVEDTARWIAALARHEQNAAVGTTAGLALPFRPAAAGPAGVAAGPLAGHAPRRRRRATLDPAQAELARVPGLGPSKAAALLGHFGSLAAVRTASAEALAAAPGIGPTLAAALHRRLHG